MQYYIDGYNLLFRGFKSSNNLEEDREALIETVLEAFEKTNISASIVFDAPYSESAFARSHRNCLEIVYTEVGETADEYLIEIASTASQPKSITIVTSDNRLAQTLRSHHSKTMKVEKFLIWLRKKSREEEKPKKEQFNTLKDLKITKKDEAPPKKEPKKPFPPRHKPAKHIDAGSRVAYEYYLDIFTNKPEE